MDEPINISNKLSSENLSIRTRTSSTILSKLNMNLLFQNKISNDKIMKSLAGGLHKGLLLSIDNLKLNKQDDDREFTSNLLKIIQITGIHPLSTVAVEEFTKILEQLYFMSALEEFSFSDLTKDAIDSICTVHKRSGVDYDETVDHMSEEIYNSFGAFRELSAAQTVQSNTRPLTDTQGAGVILRSSLVYTGWKFPSFVVTECDEKILFELMVHIQMNHDRTAAVLWEVVTDFPVQALIAKTGVLHALFNVLGATHTQADINANPEGLNPLTVLNWLRRLLQRTEHAYAVQMEGSSCCSVPDLTAFYGPSDSGADTSRSEQVESQRDLSCRLAHTMYAMRHPLLPSAASLSAEQDLLRSRDLAEACIPPVPSLAGLAFACCAASMPLLQSGDVTTATHVLELLRTALPLVLEASELAATDSSGLEKIPHARLQHLLDRLEQLVVFHNSSSSFDMGTFLSSLGCSEEGVEEKKEVETGTFQLCFLATTVELFRVVPAALFAGTDSTAGRFLELGEHTLALLCRMVASPSLDSLLPYFGDALVAVLRRHAPAMLRNLQRATSLVKSARMFTVRNLSEISAASDLSDLVRHLVDHAQVAVSLLDRREGPVCEDLLDPDRENLSQTLPLLLLLSRQHCDWQTENGVDAVHAAMDLLLRVVLCGSNVSRLVVLTQLRVWLTRSYDMMANVHNSVCSTDELSPLQQLLVTRLDLNPAMGRDVLSTLSAPPLVRGLLLMCVFRNGEVSVSDCDTDEQAEALCHVATELIEIVCEFLVSGGPILSESVLVEWVGVLGPLKALEWERDCGASGAVGSGEVRATAKFTRILQEFCGASGSPVHRATYFRTLSTGLFHRSGDVRVTSALKIHRELLHTSSIELPSQENTTRITGSAVLKTGQFGVNYDPFGPQSSAQLDTDWSVRAADLSPKMMSPSVVPGGSSVGFSHADLANLTHIAFASTGLEDTVVQARSLSQLLDMLAGDTHLLHTCEAGWLVRLTNRVVGVISAALRALEDVHYRSVSNASQQALEQLRSVGDASVLSGDCHLLIVAARLFAFIILNVDVVRQAVVFEPVDVASASAVDISVAVRCFLGANLLKRGTNKAVGEMYSAVVQAGQLCGLALQTCCMSASSYWDVLGAADDGAFDLRGQFASRLVFTGNAQESSSAKGPGKGRRNAVVANVVVPSLVVGMFRKISVSTALLPCEVCFSQARQTVCSAETAGAESFLSTESAILSVVVREQDVGCEEDIHLAVATSLFERITGAESHSALRAALAVTRCLGTAYPDLYRVFASLGLSLFTAVSNIVMNPPRAHKDFVTLSTVLKFLTHVFEQLRFTGPHFASTVDLCNEASGAVIEPLAQFLRENVTTQYVPLRFASLEEEKELKRASQSVVLQFGRLLCVLSSFQHASLQLSTHLAGSFGLEYLLRHVLYCETADTRLKATVSGLVEQLLCHHDGLFLLQSSQITGSGSRATTDGNSVVENIIRSVKLLRTPNSMQGSSGVVGNLRILHLILKGAASGDTSSPLWASLFAPSVSWRWVTRLAYDRRSEVKLLAFQILGLVLETRGELTKLDGESNSRSFLEDSLDQGRDDEPDAELEAARDRSEEQWPPLYVLYSALKDSVESRGVRALAISIVVSCIARRAASSPDDTLEQDGVNLRVLLAAMTECLSLSNEMSGAASIDLVVEALLRLVGLAVTDERLARELLPLVGSLKLIPLLVETLHSGVADVLQDRAQGRVSPAPGYIGSEHRQNYSSDLMTAFKQPQSIERKNGEEEETTCSNKHQMIRAAGRCQAENTLFVVQGNVCRVLCLLRHLNSSGEQVMSVGEGLLYECLRHTHASKYLLDNLCRPSRRGGSDLSVVAVFELPCFQTHAQLLSLLIADDCCGVASGGKQSVLQRCLAEGIFIVEDLVKQLVRYLHLATRSSDVLLATDDTLECYDALFRLLASMLSSPQWRMHMSLGGPFPGSGALGMFSEYLFALCLAFRALVEGAATKRNSSSTSDGSVVIDRLLLKVNLVISLLLQHSHAARVLLMQPSDESSSDSRGLQLFRSSVLLLSHAADFLSRPVELTPELRASVGRKASLKSVNSKLNSVTSALAEKPHASDSRSISSAASSKASTVNNHKVAIQRPASSTLSASSAMRQSTSTLGARSSATHSTTGRWRDKSRGYAWADKDKATKPVAMPSDFTEAFKLQLYCALSILTHALPSCDEAISMASALHLPHILSRLLRYAASHSFNASLSSGTAAHLQQLSGGSSSKGSRAWVPSSGVLAGGIYALCCAFTFECDVSKLQLANSGENRASTATTAFNTGNTLQHLVSLGVNYGVARPVRWLSLSLTAALVTAHTKQQIGSTPSLRTTLATTVAASLQRQVSQPHVDSPEAVYYLLSCLTAFISSSSSSSSERISGGVVAGGGQQGGFYNAACTLAVLDRDASSTEAKVGGPAADTKLVPFPELVQWVYDVFGPRHEVALALCRCLGSVPVSGAGNTASLLTEPLIDILCENHVRHVHPEVSIAASVALWGAVHQSEKAKALAKEALLRLSAGGGGGAKSGTLITGDANRTDENSVANRARQLIGNLLM